MWGGCSITRIAAGSPTWVPASPTGIAGQEAPKDPLSELQARHRAWDRRGCRPPPCLPWSRSESQGALPPCDPIERTCRLLWCQWLGGCPRCSLCLRSADWWQGRGAMRVRDWGTQVPPGHSCTGHRWEALCAWCPCPRALALPTATPGPSHSLGFAHGGYSGAQGAAVAGSALALGAPHDRCSPQVQDAVKCRVVDRQEEGNGDSGGSFQNGHAQLMVGLGAAPHSGPRAAPQVQLGALRLAQVVGSGAPRAMPSHPQPQPRRLTQSRPVLPGSPGPCTPPAPHLGPSAGAPPRSGQCLSCLMLGPPCRFPASFPGS